MTLTRLHLEIFGAIILIIAGVVALQEHDAHVREQAVASAVKDAQDTFQRQIQAQAADYDAKLKARDSQFQQTSKDLNDKFAQAAKNEVTMAALLSQIAKLPVPITVQTPPATKGNPNPASVVNVPQIDFPAVKVYAHECEQCKLDRDKLQADLADREAQAALAQKQIDSIKQQRDAALVAAKGGTALQRTLKSLKVAACAGGGAAAGSGRGAQGAAIGAVGAAIVCGLI